MTDIYTSLLFRDVAFIEFILKEKLFVYSLESNNYVYRLKKKKKKKKREEERKAKQIIFFKRCTHMQN